MRNGQGSERNRNYRRIFAVSAVSIVLFFIFASNACISTITPPGKVEVPIDVFLLKEARHTGLVLPDGKGGFVEFGYGDWDWFALMHNQWYHVFDTVLWPTQGCLGRRPIPCVDGHPHRQGAAMQPVTVEAAGARNLLDLLSHRFEDQITTVHKNELYGFEFVHCDQSFWLFYNCHDSIAEWMEALGCTTTWRPVRLGIETAAAEEELHYKQETFHEKPADTGRDSERALSLRNSPAWSARKTERDRMVRFQIEDRGISDPRVLAAMREVPRHLFVPVKAQAEAYADYPLRIGEGQTISQPYIVACMTEYLDVQPNHKVLEIGTGSGYQAAILGELAEEVYTIEIIESLGEQARELLQQVGCNNVHVRIGDGYQGWPEKAPFDAIMVTAAPDHIPEPLIAQLKPGGRLLLPVGDLYQELTRITRTGEGTRSERLLPVRFVPMTGEAEKQGKRPGQAEQESD
ncbi:MAG: protein-L-isoaspartate(D-aspartate) O-methyltransferase [Planctomycetota bacterium]